MQNFSTALGCYSVVSVIYYKYCHLYRANNLLLHFFESLSQVLCSLIKAAKSATNLNINHNNGNFLHQGGIQYFHIL